MAVYAVGDLQGCLRPLDALLERVSFDPARDQLWLVGDLVNRGPDSLGCLRRVKALGDAAVTVLGNHDLHLLATAAGLRSVRSRDTLDAVLAAPEAAEYLEWLAHRPLLYTDDELGWTLVHAGLPPAWTLQRAHAEARRVEALLRDSAQRKDFLAQMYGNQPNVWSERLRGVERARYCVNALTRMRYLEQSEALDFSESGPPEAAPRRLQPWFQVPWRRSRGLPLVFGHWSALGFRQGPDWLSLDSGCVWGRSLTMVQLTRGLDAELKVWQEPCP